MSAAEIAVLLVDDDVEWVTAAGASLESADESLSVITATGGWEALDLLEDGGFDCVVCDYRMPDFDGIALLERIRAEYGDVPFILITGSGSEAVASRAISSQVTDYFVKDPGQDQSPALAMRIRTAVEARRTERSLAAARRRFAALFESVPDPVAIADERGTLQEANEAFLDAFGRERGDVESSTLESVVPGAGDLIGDEGTGTSVRSLAAETTRGRREFLVRRFPLEGPESPEFGYVFTDITRQRDRERELERFHELSADVRELLLSAESREELEANFCETVVSSIEGAAALARGSGAADVSVRATAGDVDEDLERALFDGPDADPEEGPGHPVGAALAAGESQYVADVGEVPAEWAAVAHSRGVREVLAVPVERRGMPTGAFVVCSSSPSTLDEATRTRLEGLVSSLGDAMDLVDRVTALTADRAVRVRLSVGDDESFLAGLGRATAAAADVVSAIPRGDGTTALYLELEVDGREDALAWLDGADEVTDHEVVAESGSSRIRVDTTAPTVPAALARLPAAVRSIRVGDGRTTVSFDVPLSADVREVVGAIEDDWGAVTVDSIRTVEREGDGAEGTSPLGDLTAKQRRALETAFREGYFEQPRSQSADDVAAALSVSRSTFLQHLRTAERKLLKNVFTRKPPVREEEP